jgi:hypothetical protein
MEHPLVLLVGGARAAVNEPKGRARPTSPEWGVCTMAASAPPADHGGRGERTLRRSDTIRWYLAFTLAALAAGLVVPSVRATPPLLPAARAAGQAATGCQYCHSFETTHMMAEARRAGLSNMDCGACHGARLPKSGAALFNDRGQWLVAQKKLRRAAKVDVGWLRAYKEPSPSAAKR